MIKSAIFIILVGFLFADEIDELEYLYSLQDQFLYIPDNLYKEDGLWYSTSDENPYNPSLCHEENMQRTSQFLKP